MTTSNNIYFSLIKIDGYRGRHFELRMRPRGEHSVFVMDGNTGKTTTIELLRWCFKWKESEAKGRFRHMWQNPAHVLDNKVKGKQVCTITIQFSDGIHEYSFKRVTTGEYSWEKDENDKVIGDIIEKIEDTLEIDRGKEVYQHDDVYRYLSTKFRFNQCAEYFCFDGEKAREVMMYSADAGQLYKLLDTVNQRTTHPLLKEYKSQLESLEKRVYSASKSRVTDKALKMNLDKLMKEKEDLKRHEEEDKDLTEEIQSYDKAIFELDQEIKQLDEQITDTKSENLLKKTSIQQTIEKIAENIENKRSEIYKNSLDWISIDINSSINKIKQKVKETGKLPEPYREELIKSCLESTPPTCQICGRVLDDESKRRVKQLKELIAPHDVHTFLTTEFNLDLTSFDPRTMNDEIQRLLNEYEAQVKQLKSIKLSNQEEQMIANRNKKREQLDALKEKRRDLIGEREALRIIMKEELKKIRELEEKNAALEENRIILDKIKNTMETIAKAEEKMKEKAISIISEVISQGVSSILGKRFGAKLTLQDGLLLGEDGFYSVEAGGMSGRLILSYCFAEAMTLIDPIIVDTPSGNIGSHRRALARHLKANHNQVILLCLPTEVPDFANILTEERNMITIRNKEGGA